MTDWFPTLVQIAGAAFNTTEYPLDGVSQVTGLLGGATVSTRQYMLYNAYADVMMRSFNDSFAIRNRKYKLIAAYVGNPTSHWYTIKDADQDDDDDDAEAKVQESFDPEMCMQQAALKGSFKYFLYNLQEDPFEETNLYGNSDDEDVQDAKVW